MTLASSQLLGFQGLTAPVPSPTPLPGKPQGLIATAGDTVVQLSWDPVTTGAPISSYTVTVQPGGRTISVPPTSVITTGIGTGRLITTVPNLVNCTPYTFTVAGVNAAGTGLASDQAGATPKGLNICDVYVAMGDSFSAEGGDSYTSDSDTTSDQCHRSQDSYPYLLAKTPLAPKPFHSYACSGATTDNMMGTYNSEPPQVSRLGLQTKLVTITAGGNDAGFKDVATECFFAAALRHPERLIVNQVGLLHTIGVALLSYKLTPAGREQLRVQTARCRSRSNLDNIDAVAGKLDKLYGVIRTAAPTARVLVNLYPFQLPTAGSSVAKQDLCVIFDDEDLRWMNGLQSRMNSVIAKAASAKQFEVVPGSDLAFAGHEQCSGSPDVNTITGDLAGFAAHPSTDISKTVGPKTLHPNHDGYQSMASAMESYLRTHPL